MGFVASFIFWPIGLFLGSRAYRQIRQTPQEGEGLALAAIVISGVAGVASIVLVVLRVRHG